MLHFYFVFTTNVAFYSVEQRRADYDGETETRILKKRRRRKFEILHENCKWRHSSRAPRHCPWAFTFVLRLLHRWLCPGIAAIHQNGFHIWHCTYLRHNGSIWLHPISSHHITRTEYASQRPTWREICVCAGKQSRIYFFHFYFFCKCEVHNVRRGVAGQTFVLVRL